MSAFNDLNVVGQAFAEATMGETFSFIDQNGPGLTGLVGVFNQAKAEYTFTDFTFRRNITTTLVTSKGQWGIYLPNTRDKITDSSGNSFYIDDILGVTSAGEPAYELGLVALT